MRKSQADLLRGTEIRAAESQPEGSVDKTAQDVQCQSAPNSIHRRSWTVCVLHKWLFAGIPTARGAGANAESRPAR